MSVLKKLMQARIMLQSKELKKSGHNKFAGYYYFELGDFLPTVQEIFSGLGLCGVVSYTSDLATLRIYDTDGEHPPVEITSPMGGASLKGCHEVQNIGAVETYQRRYLWVTAMEIVEHDVLDAVAGKDNKVQPPMESAKTIAQDVWESQTEDEKIFLQDIAIEIVAAISENKTATAYKLFYENKLDQEQQTALWSRLDSGQRKSIKEYRKEIVNQA